MGESRPLAVLTTSYPAHAADGAGTFVRGFCRACVRAGHRVEVLCPQLPEPGGDPRDHGVAVRRLGYARPRRWQRLSTLPGAPDLLAASRWRWGPALAFSARLAAAFAARRRRYGGVVSHWLVPSTLAGVMGAPGMPHVGIAHGTDVHLLQRLPGRRAVARALAARTSRLVFVSDALRDRFAHVAGPGFDSRRSVVQPMGVERGPRVSRDAARGQLGVAGPLLLWMGRFVPVKAPGRALEVLSQLPEANLVYAGAGPLESELRRRAARFGERVRFAGWAHGAHKAALWAAADALLMTSTTLPDGRSEGMPVVLLEARAAGVPVVHSAAEFAAATRGPPTDRYGWDAALPRILGGDFP